MPLVPAGIDALAGLELGGVPLATMMSQVSGLPARFVRKEAKTYGTCRLAEGGELDGRRLCIVEDVVTSGGAILDAAVELRARGAVLGPVVCVIDRESGGVEKLAAEGPRAPRALHDDASSRPRASVDVARHSQERSDSARARDLGARSVVRAFEPVVAEVVGPSRRPRTSACVGLQPGVDEVDAAASRRCSRRAAQPDAERADEYDQPRRAEP